MTHLGFGHFITISGHFFANYINIFHKTEVLMNIFWCQKYLNLNWIKDYDIEHNFSCFHFFQFCKKKKWKSRPHKWLSYDHFWPFLVRLHQIFHKTEVQTVFLRFLVYLYLHWIKSYAKNSFFFMSENASFQGYFAEVCFGTS